MTRLIIISLAFLMSNSLMAQEKAFTVVEEMPIWVDCENDSISTKRCTEIQLLTFFYKNIEYPRKAKKNKTKGIVIVTFSVNENGKIEQTSIVRDIGDGCGKEVLRVVNMMNEGASKWIAGKQNGKKVKVQYIVPIRFKGE
jgi:TonB family protein